MLPLIAAIVLVGLVVTASLVVRTRGRREEATAPPTRPRTAQTAGLGSAVRALFRTGDPRWSELREVLVKADVGPRGSDELVERVRRAYSPGSDPARILEDQIVQILGNGHDLGVADGRLSVILVVGVNGSGKTTTIGKMAKRLAAQGKRVSIAASDTFRAAAGEQLEVWAQRAGAHLVAQDRGADPGSVAFDAVVSAKAKGSDVLIVDTAGRLHTKQPLMDELAKVRRTIQKAGGTIDETLLVLDATTGQNGIAQARAFTEAVEVTGVALTKMDGSAKGGVVIAVREELGVPVRLVGTGESLDALEPFDPAAFAKRLVNG